MGDLTPGQRRPAMAVGLESWPKIETSVRCPPWSLDGLFGLHSARAAGWVVDAAGELLALDAVFLQFSPEVVAARLEAVGNVLEKRQPQHDMLVLGGVELAAKGVGGAPEVRRKIKIGV